MSNNIEYVYFKTTVYIEFFHLKPEKVCLHCMLKNCHYLIKENAHLFSQLLGEFWDTVHYKG